MKLLIIQCLKILENGIVATMSLDMPDLDPEEVQELMEKEEDIEDEAALTTTCVAGIQAFIIICKIIGCLN